MTASPDRRRMGTMAGAIGTFVAIVLVIAVASVAFVTLRTSNEGRAPEADLRPIVSYPETPNTVVGIVGDFDRLTSLAVVTLDPSGSGGSILSIPVNADVNNGFGSDRLPISRQPYTPGDEQHAAELVSELEPLLTLTIERGIVLGPDELAALVAPIAPIDVDLPERVVDSDTPGSGFVAGAGNRELDADTLVEAFTAIAADGSSYSHHDIDVALWSALAENTPIDSSDVELPRNEFDRPVAPATPEQLIERLLAGDVAARDLSVDVVATESATNDNDDDFVVVDRADALLVFGAVSPSLVSRPNESLSFKLVVPFTDDQVAALGDDAAGNPVTKTSMTRRFIGQLLFGQANIVAVDLASTPESVPERTRLLVADESLLEIVEATAEQFFGDAEIVLSDVITDGTDVVVVLGENFLDLRAELIETERAAAENVESGDDGVADFDLSGDSGGDTGDTVGDEEPDGTDVSVPSTDAPDVTADTVEADG